MKYIDADRLIAYLEREADIEFKKTEENANSPVLCHFHNGCRMQALDTIDFIKQLQQEQPDMGEVSDGYHTFNELYYYRMLYNAAFFNLLPKSWVHKSKRHHTGEECFGGGWFIVMANLPTGQISNHYELKDWDLFQVPEKEFADEWDGHTPQEAAERLHKYLQQEQPSEDLEKEVHRFFDECIEVYEVPLYGKVKERVIAVDNYELTARHFAEWQKGLMLKDAVEATVMATKCGDKYQQLLISDWNPMSDMCNGDKVKIIIVKED